MLFSGTQPSQKFQLSKDDLLKMGQVVLWSGASAVVGAVLTLLPQIDIPAAYLFLVPIINTVLVALKKLLDQNV